MSRRAETLSRALNDVGAKSFAEVGVWKGELAAQVMKLTDLEVYYMVDDWQNPNDADKRRQALEVADGDPRFRVIERKSVPTSLMFADGQLDAAYVDACHDYANASRDVEAWWPKVSKLLCGHDYTFWNTCANCPVGVVVAVELFAKSNGLLVTLDDDPPTDVDSRLRRAYEATLVKCLTGDAFPSWYIRKSA